MIIILVFFFFFFQAEDGIRDKLVTGVQTCALPISLAPRDEERLAADTLDGAHGAVHAAGDEPRRRLEQPLRIAHVACLPELGSDTARSTGRKSPRAASQRKAATESTRPRITDVTR